MTRLSERIENFNKAYNLFETAQNCYTNNKQNDIYKLAIVQAFEIVYELGWKVVKDFLKTKDIETFTPRDTIKEAFAANILPSAQIWIDMAKDKNASSHEYNQDKVNMILENISATYFYELKRFKENLETFNG